MDRQKETNLFEMVARNLLVEAEEQVEEGVPPEDEEDMEGALDKFEKGRIQVLQQERVEVQKRTFTRWCNAFLEKAHLMVRDLFEDLRDGKMLMKLLELISGEHLGKPNKGVLRVQKVENLNRCLQFLSTKVKYENLGAEDIVDGNPRLTLGLIWTIILRFQIQDIEYEAEDDSSSEKKSAKDALLLWCQKKTEGYPNVHIDNFTGSWRDGLAFNALIHAHRPDLIKFNKLNQQEHIANLNNAFDTAQKSLGIAKLLDAEDVDVAKPDDKSILTYVASYYHYFAKMKTELTGTKRVAKVIGNLVDVERMQDNYERITTQLLEWIHQKIRQLNDRNFPNSLEGIQQEVARFKDYRTVEKPPKYKERGNIEGDFFSIQAKLQANSRRHYVPPEGAFLRDIEIAWGKLETAEHDREMALRDELIRQEKLKRIASKFEQKATLRDAWLTDMTVVLSDQNFGNNMSQVEAALKKQETISAEIESRRDRFEALQSMAHTLYEENYHGRDRIKKREKEIMEKWKKLIELLDKKKRALAGFNDMLEMYRETESIQAEMKEIEPSLRSDDVGKHLAGVENLVHKHGLAEAQVNALGARVRNLNKRAQPYMKSLQPENQLLQKRLDNLNKDYENLHSLCQSRKAHLDGSRLYHQFIQDSEEEEAWLVEKTRACKSQDIGKDLIACSSLIKKHEALEQEMQLRQHKCHLVCDVGEQLVRNKHQAAPEIKSRVDSLNEQWRKLLEHSKQRRQRLEDAAESHTYYADANEAESWMQEKMPLVGSDDYGRDEASAKNLLQRHQNIEGEIKAFEQDINRLDQVATLMTKAANVHKLNPETTGRNLSAGHESDKSDEEGEELVEVPYEYQVEEIVEKEVIKEELVERKIPQVKALYPYDGQNMSVDKHEVMLLLNQTNADWWLVRRANGKEGYVPANYVREVEPKVISKVLKKPIKVPEKVLVTKTGVHKVPKQQAKQQQLLVPQVKQHNANGTAKHSKVRRTPSLRSQGNLHFDKENVEQRQQTLNNMYGRLAKQSQTRKKNLDDAIKLFRFNRECDSFETWMKDKEQVLQTKESLSQNMEALKRKFEMLITDLAANAQVLDEINKLANEMVASGHMEKKAILKRQKEINDRWNNLHKLKLNKEKTLEGASSIVLFQSMCDELKDWIKEKQSVLNTDDVGKDLATVQALQRRHQNLEYELEPLKDKLSKFNLLANAVRKDYPDEADFVNQKEREIMDLWKALQDKAKERKAKLADAEQEHQFNESAKDLEMWVDSMKSRLNEKETPRHVREADELLKKHKDLLDEINTNRDRFRKVDGLGDVILARNPKAFAVKEKKQKLKNDEKMLDDLWKQKNDELTAAKELQNFLREANQIDTVMAGHETLLNTAFYEPDSADGIDNVKKRQNDNDSSLENQEEKLRQLNELADRLLREGHPDAKMVDEKRRLANERYQKVKEKNAEKQRQLEASIDFQEFKKDCDELSDWIKDKYKTANDESYRDLTNLLPKLQKHQAFEAELSSNKKRLTDVNGRANDMISEKHPDEKEIKKIMNKLNQDWEDLSKKSQDKGQKLRQAAQQELLNKALEDAEAKLNEMERLLKSDDIGKDLRGVKDLLKKHQMLEKEMKTNAENLNSIVEQGHEMARAGHFDSAAILKKVKDFDKRFNDLKEPMAERRKKLEDSLKWHQYNFDADNELLWIKEHYPAAASTDYGRTLVDAQNLLAKHKKLDVELQGHQPHVDRVLATGQDLVKDKNFAKPQVEEKNKELSKAWKDLLEKAVERRKKLDNCVQKQKYLSELNNIDTWLQEQMQLTANKDFGKDEDAAAKLLAKHKSLEGNLVPYSAMVTKLREDAEKLIAADPDENADIKDKQLALEKRLKKLQAAAAERGKNLSSGKDFHEYLRESEDLAKWINEQMATANSDDYGDDYEHCEKIRSKFNEFQRGVDAGANRFKYVEKIATELVQEQSPNSALIIERQDQLKEAWDELLQQMNDREVKLMGASEIHRFNRDVEEALSRIQEKYASIPEDKGRDLKAVQNYIKKHETFENELVALEAQLQILINDSARLQETYPGGNAEQIARQQAAVLENWAILSEKSAQRKEDLQAALDLYRFLADARDFETWATQVETEMKADETVRDTASVDNLQKRHRELKVEIEARDDDYETIMETGKAMIDAGHFASTEIEEKMQDLEDVRDGLRGKWDSRRDYLEKLYDQQLFLRDANHLNTLSNSQEAYLKGSELSNSIPHGEALIKKHEAFDNLLTAQDQKLDALDESGTRLIKDGHFDSKNIGEVLRAVGQRRQYIKGLSDDRKGKLADALLYHQFQRDAAEMEGWIDDKLKIVSEQSSSKVVDLQEKMRKLQKHQAFEAEILANADRIKGVTEKGETLISRKHDQSPSINKRLNKIDAKWNELLRASNEHGKGLEEAKEILKFNEECDKVQAWIREKETLVAAGDMGKDYEHCQLLQKKVNDVGQDGVNIDAARIQAINDLADRLISQGRSDAKVIKDKKFSVNENWNRIQGDLEAHKKRLAIALEIHAFNRDVDDINGRIAEKYNHLVAQASGESKRSSRIKSNSDGPIAVDVKSGDALALSSDEFGKDLAGIQALQRKQEEIERDMTAVHDKLTKLEKQAGSLSKKYPDMAPQIVAKMKEAQDNWEKLEDLAAARRAKLEAWHSLHKFLYDADEHITWCDNMITAMTTAELASNVTEAEELLTTNQERKVEVDARYSHYVDLKKQGEALISKQHGSSKEIKKKVEELVEVWQQLNETWEERRKLLSQCYDLQVYEEFATQADDWLASKEAFLANEDLGTSLSSCAELTKKHEAFEKTLEAQEEKISTLEQLAQALLARDHYAPEQIKVRCEGVLQRRDKMKKAAVARRNKLKDSRDYQQFVKNYNEALGWLQAQMQIATDESYRDSVNLQGKIQKHQAFEAELEANKKRIEVVAEEGNDLVRKSHYATKDISEKVSLLEQRLRKLQLASHDKKVRLQEAYQALLLFRQCDDIDAWISSVELQLSSEDHGKDIITVNSLLEQQQLLEDDIAKHQEKVNDLEESAKGMSKANHFMSEEVNERAKDLLNRYNSLTEPCQIRRDNLEDTLLLYQFYRDVDDEVSWVHYKLPLAASTDLGSNFAAVQNLMKKHQVLEQELVSHEPLIEKVTNTAQHMVEKEHYASNKVQSQLEHLQGQLQKLKDLTAERKLRLTDALESQTFYSEVDEAETWIAEKMAIVKSTDFGKDEDSVQALIKKLDALDLDIDNYNKNIKQLAILSQGLIKRRHFDSKNIQHKQASIEQSYQELKDLSAARRRKLNENKTFFGFFRESDQVEKWIKEKEVVAMSEDYGTDLDHVQILEQKFDSFYSDLLANEERVNHLNSVGNHLIDSQHRQSQEIQERLHQINQLWTDIRELAQARQESLAGAKRVHAFIRDAENTMEWIAQKDLLVSSDDFGDDLDSVQSLIAKHEGFEQDLEAISKQVEAISKEAEELIYQFPDAQEHIYIKHEEKVQAWNALLEKAHNRKEKLKLAEHLQKYFNDYRDLLAWLNEMQARINADELAKDVAGAEALIARHREHKAEINMRLKDFTKFTQTGEKLIEGGHTFSNEIEEKIRDLNSSFDRLRDVWEKRNEIYEQNLDLLMLQRDMDQMHSWLGQRENILTGPLSAESIDGVEEMIRKHEDFEKTVTAQEERFNALKRLTKLEQASAAQKRQKEKERLEEEKRKEKERQEEKKRIEQERLLEERKKKKVPTATLR